ncbi:WG repeat-containing protein [Brevibacillus sp. 179-C9.3 HS]|uniref:WG repeat-containing protein n=1 Tax=unclassified Brevibacillus TaxID=2684853 RepID=UPI0039A0FB93
MKKLIVSFLVTIMAIMSFTVVRVQALDPGTTNQLYPLRKPSGASYWDTSNPSDWALSDATGKIHARFTLPAHTYLDVFENGVGIVSNSKTRKYGLIDDKGKVIVNYKFDYISSFVDGFARYSKGGKYGFIDMQGNEVIKAQFDSVGDFKFGRAVASINKKYGMIDRTGKWIIKPQYDAINYLPHQRYFPSESIQQYSNDPILIKQGDFYGYINIQGEVVIPPKFVYASEFFNGLAAVQEVGKPKGFINWNGDYAIEPQFYFATAFYNGIAYVSAWKEEGKTLGGGLIDKNGQWIVPPGDYTPFAGTSYSPDGFIRLSVHRPDDVQYQAVVNTKGEMIIPPTMFKSVGIFMNGIAKVELQDGREGFINTKGEYVVEPTYFGSFKREYGGALSFRNGLYARNWGLDGYLDYTGKLVIPPYR